ncbi:NAD-dependent epimerase/dehydratase family protein [Devosia nitrariae]|uniref:NAD-dependent epimerase n=1 Tax=Devosia nitrariae TaxID=2071872 RepID=A0ABQ5WDU5_9HYPH|nr:NAD-dependent epimerase/dehydratase family protein [Devosia nitrariae]GLQ57997.1 NAD-dependent epimerase [Devosia nitrariae]
MSVAVVTGAGGLIGSETARFLLDRGYDVVGIDNDMRAHFFGAEASTRWRLNQLSSNPHFFHIDIDIRDVAAIDACFARFGAAISAVVHAAAQPSHDWAAADPATDFSVNAVGTLNILEATRRFAPDAAVIYTSTNKVYGDLPNRLPVVELETRWELPADNPYSARGIDESMAIDQSLHSIFGVSKASADLMVQEYGRYFGIKTVCFRGGCLTGGGHSATELHGFLAYLMKCTCTGRPYRIYGHGGKQVRDNIHASDFVLAIWSFLQNPSVARVYNIGGGRFANCSMLEAIAICENLCGRKLNYSYVPDERIGDHRWWISDMSRFMDDYPSFRINWTIEDILADILAAGADRWDREPAELAD